MPQEQLDDLEAVRQITTILDPFDSDDRERILRWAREKLGMPRPPESTVQIPKVASPPQEVGATVRSSEQATDIKSFVQQKAPKNDRHLAAVVAYYFHFVARPEGRPLAESFPVGSGS